MVDAVEANKVFGENLAVLATIAGRLHELRMVLARVGFKDLAEEVGGYAGDVAVARKHISDAWGGYLHHGLAEDMKQINEIAGAVLGIKDDT